MDKTGRFGFTFLFFFVITVSVAYLSLFGYILEIFISLITVFAFIHCYHKYSLKFYLTFAYCIIAGNIFGILNFLAGYLGGNVFGQQAVDASIKARFGLILNFLGMPFMLLLLFFIMVLFRELFGRPLTPGLKKASLITGLVLTVVATFLYIDLFSLELSPAGRIIQISLEILVILMLLAAIGQGFLYLRNIRDRQHRRVLLIFTLLFLGLFVILTVNIKMIPGLVSDMAVFFPWELLLLLFMVKKMNPFYLLQPASLERSGSLEKLYRKYGITEREREIISLICRGNTNRDIEEALFISLQTVKNNIYSIFKKLNVKNRVELVNVVRLQAAGEAVSWKQG